MFPEQVTPQVLGAPPAKGTKEYNAEINQVIARQAKLTQAQKDVIWKEDHITPTMIVLPVLGTQYTEENYPALYTLLRHAASDTWRIGDTIQTYYQSPRPWYADERVQLLVPKITSPGYPSGHTATNSTWAHVLSDLFPAKREALFARAMAIGGHRVDGGAHFPHDVAGGRKLADTLYPIMKENPEFQREFAAAKAEIQAKK